MFPKLSVTASAQPFAGIYGGHLIATAEDTNDGIHYLQESTAADGYLVTSRLDMGRPGKQKRLNQIAVLLSDHAASFGCTIEYRTDDTAAWTSGGTDTSARRALVQSLKDTFYTLQLRLTLDDDTGNSEDIRIDSISVIYSVDV